jgi:hypothetical protein
VTAFIDKRARVLQNPPHVAEAVKGLAYQLTFHPIHTRNMTERLQMCVYEESPATQSGRGRGVVSLGVSTDSISTLSMYLY